jgi:hypothetical protein
MRHRQTKESATARLHLNHRATPRLYPFFRHSVMQAGLNDMIYFRVESRKLMATLPVPLHRVPPPKESMKSSKKSRVKETELNLTSLRRFSWLPGLTPSIKHQDSDGDTLNVTASVNSPEVLIRQIPRSDGSGQASYRNPPFFRKCDPALRTRRGLGDQDGRMGEKKRLPRMASRAAVMRSVRMRRFTT